MLLKFPFLKNKRIIATSGSLILLIAAVIWTSVLVNRETFYKGIIIENTDLSGLSKNEGKLVIDNKVNSFCNKQKLELKYGENSWSFDLKDISYRLLTETAVEKAYSMGRSGNLFQRVYTIMTLNFESAVIKPECSFSREKISSILSEIKAQIEVEAKDASAFYKNGTINLDKETRGRLLDIDKNVEIVENHIISRNFGGIELVVDEIKPKILYSDISEINGIIASFSTTFNEQDTNRTHNIKLACEKLNNAILLPDEIFSMDKILGPRTIENGYMEAPVIYKNELIKGAGGGVCQVTTTLYDSVLKSKLEVLERAHHTLPLGYVEPGQDATIAENSIDFKFQNNKGYPVCISAEVVKNVINIRILSKKTDDGTIVKLRSMIVEQFPPDDDEIIIDNSIPDDRKIVAREAKNGLRAVLYRETYDKSGALLQREKISDDVYQPIRAQIKVNENYIFSETIR